MEKKEIAILEKKVLPVIEAARSFPQIKNDADMKKATVVLSELGRYYDQIVAKREEITKPLNLALANARAIFAPLEKPAKAELDTLRTRIADYQTEQMRLVEEEEERITARVKPGKGNLSNETAMAKLDEIEKPVASINTEAGSLKFRKDPILEITDESLIPDEYWIIDEKKLWADVKAGTEVTGAKVGFKMIPVNTR